MTIQVDPDGLDRWTVGAEQMVEDLAAQSGTLEGAMERFRASDGWWEHVSPAALPPVEYDLVAALVRFDRLADLVPRLAAAFRRLDGSGEDGTLTFDREPHIPWVPALDLDTLIVEYDGRIVVLGGDEGQRTRLEPDGDGGYVLVVSRPDGEGGWETVARRPLTSDQAGDLLIRAGDGNNVIEIPPEYDGHVVITTGRGDNLVGWEGENAAYRHGGGGDKRIFLGDGDNVVYGGSGDDHVWGGGGHDYLEGGEGDNRLFAGGGAQNTVYGGSGDDVIVGSADGDDFLVGGAGDDEIHGVGGRNTIGATEGSNRVVTGSGDDTVLVGGDGRQRVVSGGGEDTVMGDDRRTHATDVEHRITVEVDPDAGEVAIDLRRPGWMSDDEWAAWQRRVVTDLSVIRATPSGAEGLSALDQVAQEGGQVVTVLPYSGRDDPHDFGRDDGYDSSVWIVDGNTLRGNYASAPSDHPLSFLPGVDDTPAHVNYGPAHSGLGGVHRPPVLSLYHELSHSFDQMSGGTESGYYREVVVDADGDPVTGPDGRPIESYAPRAEINAVGYGDGSGGQATRPSAGGVDHPEGLTENALREDLGRDPRTGYPSTDPQGRTRGVPYRHELGEGESVRYELVDREDMPDDWLRMYER